MPVIAFAAFIVVANQAFASSTGEEAVFQAVRPIRRGSGQPPHDHFHERTIRQDLLVADKQDRPYGVGMYTNTRARGQVSDAWNLSGQGAGAGL